jgi:hypothetical protein
MTVSMVLVFPGFSSQIIGWRISQVTFFWVTEKNRRNDPKAQMEDSDGIQPPDCKCMDDSNFIYNKSGKHLPVNVSIWAEKYFEKSQIWIRSYIVVI